MREFCHLLLTQGSTCTKTLSEKVLRNNLHIFSVKVIRGLQDSDSAPFIQTVALSSGDSTQYICHLLQFNLKIHKETICLNCQVLHKSVIFLLILIISQVTSFYGYHIQDFNLAIKSIAKRYTT